MKYEDEKSIDGVQKSKFFSDFFASVFLKRNQIDQNRTLANKNHKQVNIISKRVSDPPPGGD